MQSSLKCSALTLLATLSAVTAPAGAQPQPAPLGNTITGHVNDARTGRPSTSAVVSVYWHNEEVGHARPDENGDFAVNNLPPAQPHSGLFVLVARLPSPVAFGPPLAAPAMAAVAPGTKQPVTLTLTELVPLWVKVTTTAGKPLAGARVTVAKLWIPSARAWPHEQLSWPDSNPATTAEDGTATVIGLPGPLPAAVLDKATPTNRAQAGPATTVQAQPAHTIEAQLVAHKVDFADNVVIVKSPQTAEVSIPLPRETIITGTLMLGDERPLGVPQWRMKMQGWGFLWGEYDQWRMCNLNRKGNYEIDNVPSLDILKEPTYSMNLDLDGVEHPTPDISASYVPPRQGWNVLVTIQRNGQTERWIAYVEAMNSGVKYTEGEQVHHDLHLQPMALLKGKLQLKGKPPLRISYHDPRSIYGDWSATPAADGSFELPVPVGDVTLKVGNHTMTVTGLKPHEVRAVQVPLTAP